MSIEAMKQALEAIEVIADSDLSGTDLTVAGYMAHAFAAKAREASIPLRQAIAEAEQAQPKPFTTEQLHSIREYQKLLEALGPVWAPMSYHFSAAIEAAHGIKGDT